MSEKFTIEEIMLIKSCNTKNKDKVVLILKSFLKDVKDVGSEMAETIRNTIDKLQELNQEEFLEAADYPI